MVPSRSRNTAGFIARAVGRGPRILSPAVKTRFRGADKRRVRITLRLALPFVLLTLLVAALPASAQAGDSVAPNESVWPFPGVLPPKYKISEREAQRRALPTPAGRKFRAEYPHIPANVYIVGIHNGVGYWEVDFEGKKLVLGDVEV